MGVGFVVFGVGAEVQGGIADVLGVGRTANGAPSVEEARERVEENPRDANALRDLASALVTEGRPDEAIEPLERYTQLRPRDEGALRELAGLHVGRANRIREEAQQAQLAAQLAAPGMELLPPPSTPLGQALAKRPISDAVVAVATQRLTGLVTELQQSYTSALRVYQRLATLQPRDANVQILLADAALNAGDTRTALGAYRRFVQLAPDDPLAPRIREEIKRLERETQPGAAAGGGGYTPAVAARARDVTGTA